MAGNNNGRLTNAIGESLSPAAIKLTVPRRCTRRWPSGRPAGRDACLDPAFPHTRRTRCSTSPPAFPVHRRRRSDTRRTRSSLPWDRNGRSRNGSPAGRRVQSSTRHPCAFRREGGRRVPALRRRHDEQRAADEGRAAARRLDPEPLTGLSPSPAPSGPLPAARLWHGRTPVRCAHSSGPSPA